MLILKFRMIQEQKGTRTTPPKPRELGCKKVCLSCNFDQWYTNFALLASQSLTSPSLLPVKNKLVFGTVDILVILPSDHLIKKIRFKESCITFYHIKNMSVPKWAFGIYQSIPFRFWSPTFLPTPARMSELEDGLMLRSPLSVCLCLLVLPVAMYRKSWSPTSPPLPPVKIRGETEPLPMSLSNTERERVPPSQEKVIVSTTIGKRKFTNLMHMLTNHIAIYKTINMPRPPKKRWGRAFFFFGGVGGGGLMY